MRDQKDSLSPLSCTSPIEPLDGTRPVCLTRRVTAQDPNWTPLARVDHRADQLGTGIDGDTRGVGDRRRGGAGSRWTRRRRAASRCPRRRRSTPCPRGWGARKGGTASRTGFIARVVAANPAPGAAILRVAASSSPCSVVDTPGTSPRSIRSRRRHVEMVPVLPCGSRAMTATERPAASRSSTARRNSAGCPRRPVGSC